MDSVQQKIIETLMFPGGDLGLTWTNTHYLINNVVSIK